MSMMRDMFGSSGNNFFTPGASTSGFQAAHTNKQIDSRMNANSDALKAQAAMLSARGGYANNMAQANMLNAQQQAAKNNAMMQAYVQRFGQGPSTVKSGDLAGGKYPGQITKATPQDAAQTPAVSYQPLAGGVAAYVNSRWAADGNAQGSPYYKKAYT